MVNKKRQWLCGLGGHDYINKSNYYFVIPKFIEESHGGAIYRCKILICKHCEKVKYVHDFIDFYYDIKGAEQRVIFMNNNGKEY